MKQIIVTLLLIAAVSVPSIAYASEYIIYLRDRTQIRGTYLGIQNDNVCYRTDAYPLILIPLASIKNVYKGRTNVTTLVMTNQLPAEGTPQSYQLALSDSLVYVDADRRQAAALNDIRGSINMVAIPLWAAAILSLVSTIIIANN